MQVRSDLDKIRNNKPCWNKVSEPFCRPGSCLDFEEPHAALSLPCSAYRKIFMCLSPETGLFINNARIDDQKASPANGMECYNKRKEALPTPAHILFRKHHPLGE